MKWEEFKGMPFGKKLQWILHYYGIAIVVTVIAISVVITVIKSILGPGEVYGVRVMIFDTYCSADRGELFRRELSDLLGEECEVVVYHPNDEVQRQSFIVRLTSEPDLIIAPEEEMRELRENEYFSQMEEVPKDAYYYSAFPESYAYEGSGEEALYIGMTGSSEKKDVQSYVNSYFNGK